METKKFMPFDEKKDRRKETFKKYEDSKRDERNKIRNALNKERYLNDPEYREKVKAYAKAYQLKKKGKKGG